MNENQDRNFKVVHVTLTEVVDEQPDPPPPELETKFNSIQEWLVTICDGNKPEKSIDTYQIGLFESPVDYILFLAGFNTHTQGNRAVTNIDFEPSNMYFRLPVNEYHNLTRKEIIAKLKTQLIDFTKSEKFKKSFLAQAKSIKIDFNGEIWSNKQ
jgi:hypothetical protein